MLRTILVDDELASLEQFRMECSHMEEMELAGVFCSAEDALRFVKGEKEKKREINFALLDVELPGMGGIELARRIRTYYPQIVIIFATAYSEYMAEAFREKADYYITKPYGKEEIREVIARAGLLAKRQCPKVVIHTFGRFNVFAGEKPVIFTRPKAKELLALCVDHQGGQVSMEEAVDKLWEDRAYDGKVKQRYRTTLMQLRDTLKQYGIESLFGSVRGACYIYKEGIECDYFGFLKGEPEDILKFQGEYMTDYSWGEETLAGLEKMKEENCIHKKTKIF